jgi:spore coat polysaccharide biosynthesis protein SpsF
MERILAAKSYSKVVVATTKNPEDDSIVEICESEGYNYFRGHATDLLDRHYKAALQFNADIAVKIPSDCPLIDTTVIDKVIGYFLDNKDSYDFVSNLHPATYPDGNDVEVMPFHILKKAWDEAEKSYELEHTTPYIWDNPHKFRIGNVVWETGKDYSLSHRFTVDYKEDYEFINAVYKELYPVNPKFGLQDILELLENKPEIYALNNKYAGVNWYRNNLKELKTVGPSETRLYHAVC